MQKLIGVHNPLKNKSLFENLNEIMKYGGNFIQIFIGSPSKFYHSKYEFIKKYKLLAPEIKEFNNINNTNIIIHSNYINNIASSMPFNKQHTENNEKIKLYIKIILQELEIAHIIGALGCVLHSGKYIKLDINDAIKNMYYSIKFILKKIIKNKWNVKLYLELNAGSGSDILLTNNSLKSFISFYNKFNNKYKKYLKLCIDTCHLFVSGYDLNNKQKIKQLYNEIKNEIKIENLGLIHFNNSKYKLGTCIDRHENINDGFIKKKNLYYLLKKFKKYNIPIILETPNDYKKILKKIL